MSGCLGTSLTGGNEGISPVPPRDSLAQMQIGRVEFELLQRKPWSGPRRYFYSFSRAVGACTHLIIASSGGLSHRPLLLTEQLSAAAPEHGKVGPTRLLQHVVKVTEYSSARRVVTL